MEAKEELRLSVAHLRLQKLVRLGQNASAVQTATTGPFRVDWGSTGDSEAQLLSMIKQEEGREKTTGRLAGR